MEAALAATRDILDLLGGYRPAAGTHDVAVDEAGEVRPPFASFLQRFGALGVEARAELERDVRRRLQATGVAFNVYARADDRKAAWDLDLLPVILDHATWARLEAGVVQRVRLMEAVLRDLYGRQRLLRERVLPPALVFGNPQFLYPCTQWSQPPRPFLATYAIDLALDARGEWVVLGDQTDAPTGHGWVLASRLALAQTLGALFLESPVRRLVGYVGQLGDALRANGDDDGRTVVLCDGPEDPNYFSHAFLARYLGLPLVETVDVAQRGGDVFLKTLEGLQRVAVILRKRAGRELDPLHVPGYGSDGTPGLVDAARLGRVRFANALGTGALQNRTLGSFGEAVCHHLLGERLLLNDAPVRWLGDAEERRRTLGDPAWRFDRMTARHDPGVFDGDRLDNDGSEALARRLAREGHRWIAERPTLLATAPCWRDGRLQPMPWAMRIFAAVDGDDIHVMPAALGRLAGEAAAIALPSGFGSKDVWVTAAPDEPPLPALLSQRISRVEVRRSARDLLSGTAEALFWLGRYTERAEAALRTLRAVLVRLVETGPSAAMTPFLLLLVEGHLDGEIEGDGPADRLAFGIHEVLYGTESRFGLVASLAAIQRNATLARGVLSQDSWAVLNALRADRRWQRPPSPVLAQPPLELIDNALGWLVAFGGTAAEHMTRNDAWRFLDMGKRLERAWQMSDLLPRGIEPPPGMDPEPALTALLEIGDSHMTYRARYVALPMPVPVLDLLLLDETNPRGLAFQVARLEESMAELPVEGPYRSPVLRTVMALLTRLRMLDARELLPTRPRQDEVPLHTEIEIIRAALETISDQLGRAYFVLAETPTTTFSTRRAAPDGAV